jgi:hypothetical protein
MRPARILIVLAVALGLAAPSAHARTDAPPRFSLDKCCRVSWDVWHPGNYVVMGRINHPGRMVDRFFMTDDARVKQRGWICSGNTLGRGASEIRASLKPREFRGGRMYKVVVVSVAGDRTYFTEARFKIPKRLGRNADYVTRLPQRRLALDPRPRSGAGTAEPGRPPSPRAGEVEWLGPDEVTVRSGDSVTVELRYNGSQPLAESARVMHTDGFGNFLLGGPCGDDWDAKIGALQPGATVTIQVPVPCRPGDGVYYLAALDFPVTPEPDCCQGVEISPVRRLKVHVVPR